LDLLLKESASEVCGPDCRPEKGDTITTDVLDGVDRRPGFVEGEGGVARGEEGGDMVNGGRVVGEDDYVVEVGEDDRGRGVGAEGGEVVFAGGEGSRMAREKRKGARGSP
jgi:hypothetical protein